MTFELLLSRLRELLREKVKNGHLTERGMARATGVSQPHLHNILKGIRSLPPDLADQLLDLAGFDLPGLLGAPAGQQPGRGGGLHEFKNGVSGGDTGPGPGGFSSFSLGADRLMEPRFQAGDLVYYEEDIWARTEVNSETAYLVQYQGQMLARYLRMGGQRLYLVSEESLRDPVRWEYVSLTEQHILEVVRGRIVWICRKVERPEADAAQAARRNDRRTG